jgi:hypothetical protein
MLRGVTVYIYPETVRTPQATPINVYCHCLSTEAAEETSDRMLFGAAKARGQQIREEELRKPRT